MDWTYNNVTEAKDKTRAFCEAYGLSEKEEKLILEALLSVSKPNTENLIRYFKSWVPHPQQIKHEEQLRILNKLESV